MHPAVFVVSLLAMSTVAEASLATECSCRESIIICARGNWTTLPPLIPCPYATRIRFDCNHLEVFPDGLAAFKYVDASSNRLTRLPTASKLNPEITDLKLNNNQISGSTNEFHTLSSLRRLYLDINHLTSLSFLPEHCNLHSLDVSDNDISSLTGPLQRCTKLVFFSIDRNQISSIPREVFSGMTKLKYLFLTKNHITAIPDGTFAALGDLKELLLQNNSNIQLSSGSFQGLSKLHKLDLTFNSLQNLPDGLFTPTPQLRELMLSGNKFTVLPANTFSNLNFLKKIDLWKNSLTNVPVLQNCCDDLEEYNLLMNEISVPSEDSLRSVLRGKIHTKIGGLVRPEALRWAAGAGNVTVFTSSTCSCGGLRCGSATAEFCVNTPCGDGSRFADWTAAVTVV